MCVFGIGLGSEEGVTRLEFSKRGFVDIGNYMSRGGDETF